LVLGIGSKRGVAFQTEIVSSEPNVIKLITATIYATDVRNKLKCLNLASLSP